MSKRILSVPILVYAIYQDRDEAVIGPEMDFESLPYFDKELQMDMNSNVPYLAESIISLPFEDTNFLLTRGVHLNWDFPQFLKSTAYGADSPTKLPAVPTRWLISRYTIANSHTPDQQWMVESDALLTSLKGAKIYNMAQTSLPVDIYSGERPYTYMGRVEPLEDWKKRNGEPGGNYTNWGEKHPINHAGGRESLTALGWGSPSFDVFYPNCRSVFGFHDPEGTKNHTYRVIGWYDQLADDYWLTYLKAKQGNYGFLDIDNLSHLEDDRKKGLKKEQFDKALREDFVITLEYTEEATELASPDVWERMVCCGESQWLENEMPDPAQLKFAIGNTPIEALSAIIAECPPSNDMDAIGIMKQEDSLSAILMGDRLKSKKLDIGPKFREFRHADEFADSDGGLVWVLEKVSKNPDKQVDGEQGVNKKLPPPLPEGVLPLLENLNEAQQKCDRMKDELESCRYELYADWYRYMHTAYPPPGETEEYVNAEDLMDMTQRGSLKKLNTIKKMLGEADVELIQPDTTYGELTAAKGKLQEEINRINQEISANKDKYLEEFHWEVQHRPAPRFWEPAPPAIVVAIPRATGSASTPPTQQTPGENTATTTAPLKSLACIVMDAEGIDFSPNDNFSASKILSTPDVVWNLPNNPYSTDLPIFRGEWEVEVYPAAGSVDRSSGTFNRDFIKDNYLLGENEPDLNIDPLLGNALDLKKSGNIYTGSTYVNQNLDDRYRSLLDTYCALVKSEDFTKLVTSAKDFLKKHDLLAITLNGFNAALLQRHESVQLNPADPLGFADYQTFAQEVAEALKGNFKGVSPDPHASFLPIRSGVLQVLSLRLVDVFGRFIDLSPAKVSTPISMEVPQHEDWVFLPPRLSQPARWNFRFLNARPDTQSGEHAESQSHPDSSPIHGWIVPNLLDNTLDFFEPDGRRIGSIAGKENPNMAMWPSEPLEQTQQSYLYLIKDWIDQQENDFFNAFMASIEESMDNIHPDDREGQSAFSVLMGRPMAVVHLGLELDLKGLPAKNVGWSELHSDLNRPGRSSDGFDQVQFPYRLGEYRQCNDGLVGYWTVQEEKLSDTFWVSDVLSGSLNLNELQKYDPKTADPISSDTPPLDNWLRQKNQDWEVSDEKGKTLFDYLLSEEDETIKKQDLIQPYVREGARIWEALVAGGFLTEEKTHPKIRHYAETKGLTISASDSMQHFIALIDPHGDVHLSSGIQPIKSIQLPEEFIQTALNHIEMSFLTAPILTPEDHIQISLPKEQEYGWYWQERNSWPTHPDEALLETEIPETQLEPFRTVANFPERVVIREGRLVLKHKTTSSGNQ